MFPQTLDHHVHAWIKARRSAATERVIHGLSQAGSSAAVLPVTAVAAIALTLRDQPRAAVRLLLSAGLGALAGFVLQHSFDRERPAEGRAETSSSSFPSTHTLTATAAYSVPGATLLRGDRAAERSAGLVVCTVLVPFVPVSRVILGMHWLSDAAGSAAIGGTIAATVCSVIPRD